MPVEMTFFSFQPNTSVQPIRGIDNKEIKNEIINLCQTAYSETLNGDIFLEAPKDFAGLNLSTKLESLLNPYKGKVICIQNS